MPRALHILRQWPARDWLTQWLHEDTVVIVSEQALEAVIQHPELLELLPPARHCLRSEVLLLEPAQRELIPAHLVQLADTAWVELTLQCAPLISWGD